MVTNNSINEPTAASGKVLQGQGIGTASNFSTATYPSTATSTGTILRADGTNWSATTATYPNTAGISGNVLTSNGTNWSSNTNPFGWVFISTQTASSSSSLTFTSGITATYNNYVLMWTNVESGGNLLVQLSTNGGSSYISTNYQSGLNASAYNSTTQANANTTSGFLVGSLSTGFFSNGMMFLRNMTSGSNYVEHHNSSTNYSVAFASRIELCSGAYTVASTTVNAFQLVPVSSTFSGKFTLYGIKET